MSFLMEMQMCTCFSVHPVCRKDDLESGQMLLSQAENDGVAPNLVMCRCIIGEFYTVVTEFFVLLGLASE